MPSSPPIAPGWKLGVPRSFGVSGIEPETLLYGWSAPEDAHAWNDGLEAAQKITIALPDRPVVLSLECLPFIGGPCQHQDITLYVNGFRAQFWRLRLAEIHHLEAVLAPSWFTDAGAARRLTCIWHLPCSLSPAEAGAGGDSRLLGLCFRRLTFRELPPPDAAL